MLLLIRFLLTIVTSRFRSRIGPLEESVTTFTALPHDCDLNFHLNAGRYISFMDIARVELLGRMRLLSKLLSRGWRPVMGGCVIRYRREVKPFERFDIRSKVVGWDEKWFYLEHTVEKNGVFCAVGHVRTLVRSKERKLAPSEVLRLLGDAIEQPPLPKFVAEWSDIEDAR